MDNVDEHDKNEHDHHIEGSSTSFNDNFLTITQVSNWTECEKNGQIQTCVNFHRLIIHNAHFNKMQEFF